MEGKISKQEMKEKIMEILRANRNALYIGRVPPKIKKGFIELANSEFMGDYGFTLKELYDTYIRYNGFESRLNALENRLRRLEEKEGKKVIKRLSGEEK